MLVTILAMACLPLPSLKMYLGYLGLLVFFCCFVPGLLILGGFWGDYFLYIPHNVFNLCIYVFIVLMYLI